ncbi:MAG: hypothetical protein H7335_14425 [Massilia sp.]|nr:hypothetical protein [Massilia sp.]
MLIMMTVCPCIDLSQAISVTLSVKRAFLLCGGAATDAERSPAFFRERNCTMRIDT